MRTGLTRLGAALGALVAVAPGRGDRARAALARPGPPGRRRALRRRRDHVPPPHRRAGAAQRRRARRGPGRARLRLDGDRRGVGPLRRRRHGPVPADGRLDVDAAATWSRCSRPRRAARSGSGTSAGLDRYDPRTDRFSRDRRPAVRRRAGPGGRRRRATPGSARRPGSPSSRPTGPSRASSATRRPTRSGLPHDVVEALYLADDGDLWVGTGDGLARRRGGRYQTVRPDSLGGPGPFSVTAVSPSERAGLLVGTLGDGLLAFDPATAVVRALDVGRDVIAQNVTDVHEDPTGTIWVGTLGGGLAAPDARAPTATASTRVVPEDTGSLTDDEVSAILEDRQGVLWVGDVRRARPVRPGPRHGRPPPPHRRPGLAGQQRRPRRAGRARRHALRRHRPDARPEHRRAAVLAHRDRRRRRPRAPPRPDALRGRARARSGSGRPARACRASAPDGELAAAPLPRPGGATT